jgi:hypothetical protein
MAQTAISTSRFERASHTSGVERVSQSSTDAAREYDDFPPTAHPGRELFTFSLFVLLIITAVVWGGWKLISLI